MSELPGKDVPNFADQDMFLRVFLASEREILRYVMVLVPSVSDAEEIVQQTAVVLWEKFDQYDRSLPFTPWACRFALNVTRQWMDRRRRWQRLLTGDVAADLVHRQQRLSPEFDDRLEQLKVCLQKLSADQRDLVEGYYFRQLTVESLGQRTQKSVDAVYKALQRIRQQLGDCILRTISEGRAQ